MVGRMVHAAALLLAGALAAGAAGAQSRGVPGVSDSEIKIGQTMPYSGNASAYGTIGRSELFIASGATAWGRPIKELRRQRFDGRHWQLFGDIIAG